MFVELDDIVVHAQSEGPTAGEPVLLLHSLGTNLHVWDTQAAALARTHRVIRCDLRGHGLTESKGGPFSMELLAGDALRLLDASGAPRAHVAGISIGGRIALEMAAAAPERVLSLVLCDTALEFPPFETWQQRIDAASAGGMAAIVDAVMSRWVVDQSLPSSKGLRRMLLATDPAGYAGCAAALRDARASAVAGRIACPATVIVGEEDLSTPPSAAATVRDSIPGSAMVAIPRAAHIPTFERGAEVTAAMLGHLRRASSAQPDSAAAEAGGTAGHAVMGTAHVERS